jgi:Flp pilus assembly protein TadG
MLRTPRIVRHRLRHRGERGQVIVFVTIAMVALLGIVALVIDLGRVYTAHRQLQAAADAVATATADQLADVEAGNTTLAAAETVARGYSGEAGQKNYAASLPGVVTTFEGKCITVNGSIPSWCNPTTKPNAVTVTQKTSVNMIFAKLLGIDSVGLKATSTASMGGGKPMPAHVMLVLDRTGSMNSSCSDGGKKIDCAKDGMDEFLMGMDPAYDKVGLVVLPPYSSGVCSQPKTSDGPPNDYDVYTTHYVAVGLSTDYKTSSMSTSLNQNSTLVSDINCIRAGGTTAYATAIDQAQATLLANHDPKAQDVIVFFTDGEATYGPCVDANNDGKCDNNTSPYRSQPCHQAITSAANAKNNSTTKTWVYTIGYDTPSSAQCWAWKSSGYGTKLGGGTGSCNVTKGIQFLDGCYESPTITAYNTLQQMASDSSKFYFDPNPGSLTTIFQNIADDIGSARLIDDNYAGS